MKTLLLTGLGALLITQPARPQRFISHTKPGEIRRLDGSKITFAEAEALADWIALHNRNLETIYITHAHFDHFYGLSILLDRFPGARAIATPKTVNAMQIYLSPQVERLARRLFPGQVAT